MILHLHHSQHAHTVEQKKETLIMIYDFIEKLHNNRETEIYFYLHKNFDSVTVQEIINTKGSLKKKLTFVRRGRQKEVLSPAEHGNLT